MQLRVLISSDEPEDFVIATGEQHPVREFCDLAFGELGIRLAWIGTGIEERGMVEEVEDRGENMARGIKGKTVVRVDPRYFRPTEVETLLGDATKAREELGWTPKISFQEMVAEMVHADLLLTKRDNLCDKHGFYVYQHYE